MLDGSADEEEETGGGGRYCIINFGIDLRYAPYCFRNI